MANVTEYRNFIYSEWVKLRSGETFENRNPADTDELVNIFQKSNDDDNNSAIAAAKKVYKSWRLVPAPKRADTPNRIADRTVNARDVNKAFAAMRDIYTGIFYVNAPTIGADVHLPFGGVKETGNGGRKAGVAGLDVFSEWKSVYADFSGKTQKTK